MHQQSEPVKQADVSQDSPEKLYTDIALSVQVAQSNPAKMRNWTSDERPEFEDRAEKLGIDPEPLIKKAWNA
jgi:hypothetical protein